MIEALGDPDAEVRHIAAIWLGVGRRRPGTSPPKHIPTLERALSDPDPRVRRMVAEALGRYGYDAESALPALRSATDDPMQEVRRAVANAISAIEKQALDLRSRILPEAIVELSHADPIVRSLAASRLERLGPRAAKAVPALVRCLLDREADVRRASAEALGQLGPSAAVAVPDLAKLAASDLDERVRQAATLSRSILLRDGDGTAHAP